MGSRWRWSRRVLGELRTSYNFRISETIAWMCVRQGAWWMSYDEQTIHWMIAYLTFRPSSDSKVLNKFYWILLNSNEFYWILSNHIGQIKSAPNAMCQKGCSLVANFSLSAVLAGGQYSHSLATFAHHCSGGTIVTVSSLSPTSHW